MELDLGGSCMCTAVCRETADCPDPGTGATPACAGELGLCVLFCDDSSDCPNDALCPDPDTLPEGAQGYCYFR
jgi:hypothetical protein